MLGLTRGQWIGIGIIVFSVLSTSAQQVTDLFGAYMATKIIAGSSLLTAIFGGIITMTTGQAGLIQSVKELPGIANIQINRDAPKAIALASLDPNEPKLEPAPGETGAVTATAKS